MQSRGELESVAFYLKTYAEDNDGQYPGQLLDLGNDSFLTIRWAMSICPSPAAILSNGKSPMSSPALDGMSLFSYRYIGKGLTSQSDPNCVLAYEAMSEHVPNVDEVYFVFVNSSTISLPTQKAASWIRQLEAGVNPPR
jgi:hypothetical protein